MSDSSGNSSPVEADKYLAEGEYPFNVIPDLTLGIDVRVFMQDTYWLTSKGKFFTLNQLPKQDLNTILSTMFNNAELYYTLTTQWYFKRVMSFLSGQIEAPFEYIDDLKDEAYDMIPLEPHEWLNETKLVKKIYALIDA